jgi:hypothetical protein
MLPLVSKGISFIFNTTDSIVSAPFMDLFFNGIPINCDQHDFSAKAVCSAFDDVDAVHPINDTFFKFSFFGTVG